jgi:LysR family transcriptional regulator, glycine cleavage system transcriptional activator
MGHANDIPPLNAVRSFVAAARHGSFSRAADELAVTHGAVSRQVHLLEQWLGHPPLFRRLSRGVALTPDGEALLTEFGAALDGITAAARRHKLRRGAPAASVLRVNALATFSLKWLLPRLALFHAERPDIEVRLTTSNVALDALAEDFEVVIRGGPDSFHGYVSQLIVEECRMPVCSPGLVKSGWLEEPTDLEQHTLLHIATMPRLWANWRQLVGVSNLQTTKSLTFDHFYLAIQAAIEDMGVVIAPMTLIEADLDAGRLFVPFPGTGLPARAYYAYVQQHDLFAPNVDAFLKWIVSA